MNIVHKKGKTNIHNSTLFTDTLLNKKFSNYHHAKTNRGLKDHIFTNSTDVHNIRSDIQHTHLHKTSRVRIL